MGPRHTHPGACPTIDRSPRASSLGGSTLLSDPGTSAGTAAGSGSVPRKRVPEPGEESTENVPSRAPRRSAIPCKPVPCAVPRCVEPPAVVGDLERDRTLVSAEGDGHGPGIRVLRDVLQGLEGRRILGSLDSCG